MASGDPQYTYRMPDPEVFEVGRTQVARLEVYDDQGQLVAPEAGGSSLAMMGPDGAVFGGLEVAVVSSVVQCEIPGEQLEVPISDRYQLRWTLDLPGLASPVVVPRSAVVAPFAFPRLVAEVDLVRGMYPQLERILSKADGVRLADFIGQAQEHVLAELRTLGHWPDLVVDPESLARVVREYALFLVFRASYRGSAGQVDERNKVLMDQHLETFKELWRRAAPRWDRVGEHMPGDAVQAAVSRPIHIGGAPRSKRRRDPRW